MLSASGQLALEFVCRAEGEHLSGVFFFWWSFGERTGNTSCLQLSAECRGVSPHVLSGVCTLQYHEEPLEDYGTHSAGEAESTDFGHDWKPAGSIDTTQTKV